MSISGIAQLSVCPLFLQSLAARTAVLWVCVRVCIQLPVNQSRVDRVGTLARL